MKRVNTRQDGPGQWSAVFDDFDTGDLIGRGQTEEAAIEDLRTQAIDRNDPRVQEAA